MLWLKNLVSFRDESMSDNGIRDNVNKSHTEYFIEGNEKTIKQDLFSNVK